MEPFGRGGGGGGGRGRGRRSQSISRVVVGNEQCGRGRGSEEKKQEQCERGRGSEEKKQEQCGRGRGSEEKKQEQCGRGRGSEEKKQEQCGRGRGSEEKKQPQNSSPDSRSDSDSVGMGMAKLNIGDDVDKPSAAAAASAAVGEGGFDICHRKQPGSVVLKPPLLAQNRERRKSRSSNNNGIGLSLRPGMVFLKGYLSLSDQQKIVERCRELGVGVGGFYQPGYGEGTKMHLKMMCLGKNWDPHTSQYGERRPFDGAKPPHIPPEFQTLVTNALRDSNALVPQNRLPSISPDICIVNFYSQTGRLGLHQDKDESEDSLRRGLPVVSFSIGDSAQFLYGDHRDPDKAEKLQLESGDVLIFGGPSRNVFHGVSAIHPNSAPNLLLQQTNLRPGRLNLTFRQY